MTLSTYPRAKGFSAVIRSASAAVALSLLALPGAAMADKVLRIGMTAADIPRTLASPTRVSKATASPAFRCTTP